MLLHHQITGSEDVPCLVLSSSLGATMAMWQPQMAAFTRRFRVLRYDMRGHGGSPAPAGPYSIADMANDVLDLLDAYSIQRAHFCGISLGGVLGQWLGIHAANRIDHLILCNTAAKIGTEEGWNRRIEEVRTGGMQSIADAVLSRWFTPPFAAAHPETITSIRNGILACSPEGYVGACAALRSFDLRNEIASITAPTLIVTGESDVVCTMEDAAFLHAAIRNSQLRTLPTAHLSTMEAADAFNEAAIHFLQH